ncbi:type II toxin-antitoxin system MqsA family antitoxin [Klebsiella variicola]|uniref:type II toxin-antitoxin system MqsA family antitoxin n=1 Tax=Klebsiella variicola TaxID=244366 RepID=UPI000C7BD311|nr:type II toxin-antitoxin system MqsA family antitoxin [Klebsiella variicola]PLK33723.1 hypothetical protein CYD38_14570 [Klebsiella variicola]REI48970.1 type II toxin-antitoxin system MqsA family antitoxin [Klebsiella variicola]REI53881.1 type II toxin-antitoxin system MqsA family antitoxin [Klebsiella variicola]REI57994.1 type II toxin-antitoxin system MqsA family antitoxin [Klebsiella variicola]REI63903.1 type II toxin-antitoxin system MqsA family antitoxin [Klebsiella variicola]
MKRHSFCPVCGDEGLHEMKTTILREFEGFKKEVPFHASVCGSCGSETLTDQQAKFNKRQMTDFYRAANGLLTGSQIKAIRDDLHLTQSEAASIFGGGKNAFTKYENGDVTQSLALDKLIRTSYAVPAAFNFLRENCPSVIITEINTIPAQSEIINAYTISNARRPSLARRRPKNSATVVIKSFEVDCLVHQYVTVGSQL